MEEKIYYSKYGIKVTNARFVKGDKTYAMKNISAVSRSQESPSMTGPIVGIIIGLMFVVSSLWYIGIIIIAFAGYVVYIGKPTYFLMLDTNSGKVTGYSSRNESEIDDIVEALNQAIIEN